MQSVWFNPLPLILVATDDTNSWKDMEYGTTGLPVAQHPGAFGVRRKNHVHEGVDLYAPVGTTVLAVEAGVVVAVKPFTGPKASLPWWLDTECVMVEGRSGVVVYGEIEAAGYMAVGRSISKGEHIGYIKRVLREDKGRPTAMLHLELHTPGTDECPSWDLADNRPESLLDPTPFLLKLAKTKV